MSRTSHPPLLAAALCFTLPLGLAACGNDTPSEEALHVGEAAAFLASSEGGGDIGGDAVADADGTAMQAMATEQVDAVNQEPTDMGGLCDFRARRQAVLKKYDDNGDGTLGSAELRELKADLGARREAIRPRLAQLGPRAPWGLLAGALGLRRGRQRDAVHRGAHRTGGRHGGPLRAVARGAAGEVRRQ